MPTETLHFENARAAQQLFTALPKAYFCRIMKP
jgi:hypothetical protein